MSDVNRTQEANNENIKHSSNIFMEGKDSLSCQLTSIFARLQLVNAVDFVRSEAVRLLSTLMI